MVDHRIALFLWPLTASCPRKNGKMGVSGRICLYVACYDFMLLFNVCSLVLMIYWDIVRGGLGS